MRRRGTASIVASPALVGAVVLAAVFWFGGGAIIDLLTTAPDLTRADLLDEHSMSHHR